MDFKSKNQIDTPFGTADIPPVIALLFLIFVLYLLMFFGIPCVPDTWERFEPWNSELNLTGAVYPVISNSNNDAILLYLPWDKFAHERLNDGNNPAWDPYCLCGVPLASNHLVPFFYPVYAVIANYVPPLFIMGVSGLVHTFIMAFFFYLFIREWAGNRRAAFFASCFLIVSYLPNPHYQPWPMTMVWFPAIWFIYERWLKHRNPWAGLWMALFWSAPLLSGYPSLFIQLTLFTLVWFLIRPIGLPVENRPKISSRLLIFILPFVLALGISAIQNIPTIISSADSDRTIFKPASEIAREAGLFFSANEPWQTHAKRLLQPMIPFRFAGNDFNNRGYIGTIAVIFAVFGLGRLKKKEYPRYTALLALIIGPFALIPALNFLMYGLTGGILIDPNPPVEVFGFLVLMLSAMGLKYWSLAIEKGITDENVNMACYLLAMVAMFVAVIVKCSIDKFSHLPGMNEIVQVIFATFVIAAPFFSKKPLIRTSIFPAIFYVFLLFSALIIGLYQCPSQPSKDSHFIAMPNTEAITELQRITNADTGEWGRIIRFTDKPVNVMSIENQPYTFYPNLGTYFQIPDAFGYFNLAPKARFDYFRKIQNDSVIEHRGIVEFTDPTIFTDETKLKMLGDIGVRYVLSDCDIPGFKHIYGEDKFRIYEFPIEFVKSRVFISGGIRAVEPVIILDEPGYFICNVDSSLDCTVVFNENFNKGWYAKIDDIDTKVFNSDAGLISVNVPAGRHEIEFQYILPGLIAGIRVTLLSLLIWLMSGVFLSFKRKNIPWSGSI